MKFPTSDLLLILPFLRRKLNQLRLFIVKNQTKKDKHVFECLKGTEKEA